MRKSMFYKSISLLLVIVLCTAFCADLGVNAQDINSGETEQENLLDTEIESGKVDDALTEDEREIIQTDEQQAEETEEKEQIMDVPQKQKSQEKQEPTGDTDIQSTTIAGLSEPRKEPNASMKAEQKVTWDCVWFGSYPQSEVANSDPVYDKLESAAGWDSNNDITVNESRYRRMKKEDATYAPSLGDHYSWSDSTTWHYFKYEPIKWRVLKINGNQALLLSDLTLDDQKYHTVSEDVTWETSTIRSWLNGYNASANKQGTDYSGKNFIRSAFTSGEQSAIVNTSMVNANNITFGTAGGNDTTDRVFLLSESEVYGDSAKSHGFVMNADTSDEARRCKSSTYAKAMGLSKGSCDWWLRSPGSNPRSAATVNYDGYVYRHGDDVYYDNYGVRAALNLNLSSNQWSYAGTVSSDGVVDEQTSGDENGSEVHIPVTGLEILSENQQELTVGDTFQVEYKVLPSDATIKKIKWTSEDEKIVKVDEDGLITGVREGKTVVKAETIDGGITKELQFKVKAKTEGSEKEENGGERPDVKLKSPQIVTDNSMKAGQKVIWDCVWFGSYPQSEVMSSDAIYSMLQNASEWDSNNDITMNGNRYRRMKKEDATYATSGTIGYYNWSDSDTYHYFKYEPIKWRVLKIDGEQALILSDVALDDQKYNIKNEDVTWETSTIRSWLNGYDASSNQQGMDYSRKSFIGSAFTSGEQSAIINTFVVNADNIKHGTAGGNDTSDNVFFLSESEVYGDIAKVHGFVSNIDTYDEARRCKSSTYAKAMGVRSGSDIAPSGISCKGNCYWNLRSPGFDSKSVVSVCEEGYVFYLPVYSSSYGVRAALNLNLSSNQWSYAGTVSSDGMIDELGLGLPVLEYKTTCIFSHSIRMSWSPSADDRIVGYHLYRDGVKIADVDGVTYIDTGLKEDTEYTYEISGYTKNGEETSRVSLKAATCKPMVEKIFTDNSMDRIGISNGKIYAKVKDTGNFVSIGDKTLIGNFYYYDNSNQKVNIGEALYTYSKKDEDGYVYQTDWGIEGLKTGKYTVGFEIQDPDGGTGFLEKTLFVIDTVPDKLSSVIAVGDTNQIVLSWSISHEVDTGKYYIYKREEAEDEFTLLTKINDRNTLTYKDTKVTENKKYYYYIVAVDAYEQESEPSDIAVAIPKADGEHPRVIQLTPVNGSIIGGNVDLYANAQDNIAVTKTELYISVDNGESWTLLKAVNANYCNFTLSTFEYGDKTIFIKGLAYDAAGNVSNPLAYSYKIDNSGPEKVTGLSCESTATTITLRWNDVSDKDFSFFRVEQKTKEGSFKKIKDINSTLGANIYDLASDTEYIYRVVAYDRLGNRGEASEEITVRTEKDTIAPVITSIKPNANYYNKKISLKVTGKDNTGIASILIQTSKNAVVWDDYKTLNFSGNNKTETASETLSLDDFSEGELFVRGIAVDIAGNAGDSSGSAPYVQYIVDRAAPKVPKNFKTNAVTGAIELSWDMGAEADLDSYNVYRSTDGENFSVLAKGLRSVNYWDRSAKKDTEYWYKADVCDLAGNVSAKTEAVKAVLPNDTDKPKIESYAPASGSSIGISNSRFSVMVSDNWRVDHVTVSYTVNDADTVRTLINQSEINNYYKLLSADIPVGDMKDNDVLHFNITVTDAQGLKTSENDITYTVDKTAPRVKGVSTEADKEKISIKWSGNAEDDLAGYRVYRKTASGKYTLIGQRSVSDKTEYQYHDYNALAKETYYYKIEAVDKYGNTHAKDSEAVWLLVEPVLTAKINCDKVMETKVEYYFDGSSSFADLGIASYKFDFGDGTVAEGRDSKVIHKYTAVGTYAVSLCIVDSEGNEAKTEQEVTVEEPKLLGTVNVKVVDVSGNKLTGMSVYFDLDSTSDNIKCTDTKGCAKFTASAGSYAVGAYADGYLPIKKSVVVRAGTETQIELTMVKEPIVTGEFEVDRMTLDEIIAAGIDVSNPANQQVVNVTLHLTYGSTPITMNMITNGTTIYSGETKIVDTDEGRRQLTASVVNTSKSVNGNGAGWGTADNVIIAIMDVPVEASFLKEFFDVKLHIVNHADSEFELTNNVVKLHVPDGMTLMDSNNTSANDTVRFDTLKGQEKKTVNWIIRGDKTGEYDLEADYSAVLSQFNETVSAKFKTDEPITVYGLNSIKLIADINSSIVYGGMYFDLSMQNVGGADIYLPSLDVDGDIKSLYEKKAEEDGYTSEDEIIEPGGLGETAKKEVKLLDILLKNSSGYSQNLGAKASIEKLSAGEVFTKKYVSYNSITERDIAYLKDAIYQVAEELNVSVEINMVNMNLYSIADAEEKKEQIKTDAEKRDMFNYILDTENKNFYYHIQALSDDGSKMKKEGELAYRYFDLILEWDTSFITNDDVRDITRGFVYEMLRDESFQNAVDARIDDKYLKVTKAVVDCIIQELPEDHTGDSGVTVNDEIIGTLKQSSNLKSLAKGLELEGADGFWNRLLIVTGANVGGAVFDALKHSMETNMKNFDIAGGGFSAGIAGMVGSCLKDELGKLSKVISHINKGVSAWNESVDITNKLLAIQAGQEETIYLLDVLLNNKISSGNVLYDPYKPIYDEIHSLKTGMEKGFQTQAELFVKELAVSELEGVLSTVSGKIISKLDDLYYGSGVGRFGFVQTLLKVAFGTFDYLFGWESGVKAVESLRVAGCITESLKAEVIKHRYSDDNADLFLKSLKYLIKVRLVGEKSYIELVKSSDESKQVLKKINDLEDLKENKYESLDIYYQAYKSRLLSYRDSIYQETSSMLDIPDAPKVTIDYQNEKTYESFSSDYEYSFNGSSWITADNTQILLNPGIVGKHLWVRMKGSDMHAAGNIKKLYIPSREFISADTSVRYKNGVYYIKNLPSEACYQLSDTELDQLQSTTIMKPENGKVNMLEGEKYYKYMVFALEATDSTFKSQITNIKVEKAKLLTITNDDAMGSVTGAGEYFADEEVLVKTAAKPGYEFAGWYSDGKLLSEDEEYSFNIYSDYEVEARYKVSEKNKAVELKAGSSVTIDGSNRVTYGTKLSSLVLNKAVFVEKGTNKEVAGTLRWRNPEDVPTAGTTTVFWVFIPKNSDNYAELAGDITIEVKKAQNAPNMPERIIKLPYNVGTVGNVKLPENWKWNVTDKSKPLVVGVSVDAVAVYDGKDKGNYENEAVTISLIRAADTTQIKEPENEKKDVKVSKITLSGISKKIAAGKKIKLTARVTPSNAKNKVIKWKSSNKKVATVNSAGVVVMKKGSGGKKVTITATAADGSGKKATYKITSMKGVVKKVAISGNKSVKAGKSVKLKAKVTSSKKANTDLKWTSSNEKYAKVSSSGKVKTFKAGKGKKVKITAAATDGSGKKKTVTIKIK